MTSSVTTERSTPGLRGRRLPGEPGIWVFAILDMLIFAEMFGIFGWYRAHDVAGFAAAQHDVIPPFGLAYTVILLSSSWFVVLGVTAVRRGQHELADGMVGVGVALGGAFAVIKLCEYGLKVASGITPVTNDFFMFFFLMTFVHLLHATGGLFVLTYMRRRIRALPSGGPDGQSKDMKVIETCAIYWHMVDLLWIVLFALFYLRG